MKGDNWRIGHFTSADKWIDVFGPDDVYIRVDYNDVDRPSVLKATRKMVKILNAEWTRL